MSDRFSKRLDDAAWTLQKTADEVERLAGGLLGPYRSVEVTALVGIPSSGTAAHNVLTVAVYEVGEAPQEEITEIPFLNDGPIRVRGYDGWSFGLVRSHQTMAAFRGQLQAHAAGGAWAPFGKDMVLGAMAARPPSFAPVGGMEPVPLNGILKNNFWSGSHVFHISDSEKTTWLPLLDDPQLLQRLSADVRQHLPWTLAELSDLLGDVVIQLPTTALVMRSSLPDDLQGLQIDIAWHPEVEPREVRAAGEMRFDQLIAASRMSPAFTDTTRVPFRAVDGVHSVTLWDEHSGDVLAAQAPAAYVTNVSFGMAITPHEPRVFSVPDAAGVSTPKRLDLRGRPDKTRRRPQSEPYVAWQRRRVASAEADKLEKSKDFAQYAASASPVGERERSIQDIHFLLDKYGEDGAWLWDPYLTATDVLTTLMWCPWTGAPLRAMTAGAGRKTKVQSVASYMASEQALLQQHSGNREGLDLEFRMRHGSAGWSFHDRFLIFPETPQGPLAWSLGTSVNGLGQSHHILQRASNAGLIKSAFDALWISIGVTHEIWRA